MKTNKFQTLLAHTLSTCTYLSPSLAIAAICATQSTSSGAVHASIAFLVIVEMIALVLKVGDITLGDRDLDGVPAIQYIHPRAWKKILDLPMISVVKKKQHRVITKIRNGTIDEEVIATYADYKLNSQKIDDWLEKIHFQATPKSNYYKYDHFNYAQSIGLRYQEIINSVEKLVSKDVLQKLIENKKVDSLSLQDLDEEKVLYILEHTEYGPLREVDYKDFQKLVVGNKHLENILKCLAKKTDLVDWPRIKSILVNDYKGENYDNLAKIFAGIVPDKAVQILDVIKTPTIPSFKNWPVVQEHYAYVCQNKHRLDAATFSQYERDVIATGQLLSESAAMMKGMKPSNVENTKNLIDDSLSQLLETSVNIKSNIEDSIIKDLSVHRKHLHNQR